jgi:hypothetical protein
MRSPSDFAKATIGIARRRAQGSGGDAPSRLHRPFMHRVPPRRTERLAIGAAWSWLACQDRPSQSINAIV